jgi:hypothetical protein
MQEVLLAQLWRRYKPIILIAVIVGTGYGIHMLIRYMKIRADSEKRAAIIVRPEEDEESVSEIGYIYSMRDEMFLREENRINLGWFIKVPATGNRYPADEDFYVRASDGLVTRSAAGYDYRGNWAGSPAGLSPARMPTSIAATPLPSFPQRDRHGCYEICYEVLSLDRRPHYGRACQRRYCSLPTFSIQATTFPLSSSESRCAPWRS